MRSVPRSARALIIAVVASTAMLGCTGGQPPDPSSYGDINTINDGYYGNLMFGCTGVQADGAGDYDTSSLPEADRLESPGFCTCVFRGMKETVPFADAQAFDEQQADAADDENIELPANINRVRTSCADDVDAYT